MSEPSSGRALLKKLLVVEIILVAALIGYFVWKYGNSDTPRSERSSLADTSGTPSAAAAQNSAPTKPAGPVPAAAEVNGWWQVITDPAATNAARSVHFAGVSADPKFADTFVAGVRAHSMTLDVHTVRPIDNGAAADATITLDGNRLPDGGSVLLVQTDGLWKIDKLWSCGMLTTLGGESAAC